MTPMESGEQLAQAIRIGDLAGIAAALDDARGVTADPVDFARTLIACMRAEQAAGSIVDYFTPDIPDHMIVDAEIISYGEQVADVAGRDVVHCDQCKTGWYPAEIAERGYCGSSDPRFYTAELDGCNGRFFDGADADDIQEALEAKAGQR